MHTSCAGRDAGGPEGDGLTQLPDRKGRSAPGTATKAVLLKAAATRLREREQAKSARLRSDGEIGKEL